MRKFRPTGLRAVGVGRYAPAGNTIIMIPSFPLECNTCATCYRTADGTVYHRRGFPTELTLWLRTGDPFFVARLSKEYSLVVGSCRQLAYASSLDNNASAPAHHHSKHKFIATFWKPVECSIERIPIPFPLSNYLEIFRIVELPFSQEPFLSLLLSKSKGNITIYKQTT